MMVNKAIGMIEFKESTDSLKKRRGDWEGPARG